MVKICEVVGGCEDCPKYGDDCDGDKMTEHTDLISRADAIDAIMRHHDGELDQINFGLTLAKNEIQALPSVDAVPQSEQYKKGFEDCKRAYEIELARSADAVQEAVPTVVRVTMSDGSQYYLEHERDAIQADAVQGEWIPCSEKLPSDDEIVNITWVNHNPPPYYADIAEKPFVASGLRYRDKWYWYSSVCQDLHQDFDLIDKDIEVIAWQPLPKPYKGGDDE